MLRSHLLSLTSFSFTSKKEMVQTKEEVKTWLADDSFEAYVSNFSGKWLYTNAIYSNQVKIIASAGLNSGSEISIS